MNISTLIEKIIQKNSTLSPVMVVDEAGLFAEVFEVLPGICCIEKPSGIVLTAAMENDDVKCFYLKYNMDISGFVASGKVRELSLTPEMILNEADDIRGKIVGSILLSQEQYNIFVKRFNSIYDELLSYDNIDSLVIKKVILHHICEQRMNTKELLIAVLNEQITREKLVKAELLQMFTSVVRDELSISINLYTDYRVLLLKVLITYSNIHYHECGGASMANYLLDLPDSDVSALACFVMDNADCLGPSLSKLNLTLEKVESEKLTYALPQLFVKYIGKHFDEYQSMDIYRHKLWTVEMKNVGCFAMECKKLSELLEQYVGYVCGLNTVDQLWRDYKKKLVDVDTSFRKVEALYEQLALLPEFYFEESVHRTIVELRNQYHNVIGNINGRLLRYYDSFMGGRQRVRKQSEFIEEVKFAPKTVFIFADGFRYEMAQELAGRFSDYEIVDHDVIGELPSETEIGMNSYFIIDEKVRLNEKNSFTLVGEGKAIFYIYEWRKNNLAKKLGCEVITFEEFKQKKNYQESVICFFDEADISMHHYNSATKMLEAISNLEQIIRYSLKRKYDVVLLSDHGYVDIEKKIEIQDTNITVDKKKSRYLILNRDEAVDSMYYCDNIKTADYLELGDKKLCFINSTNSLRETGRYNHGGISLQENVITAFQFRGAAEEKSIETHIIFEALKAYNELTGRIRGARGYTCNILTGTDVVFTIMIDVEDYQLHVPVRQYEPGTDFLVMVSNGEKTEKAVVKKEGGRVIDKDLDIFS